MRNLTWVFVTVFAFGCGGGQSPPTQDNDEPSGTVTDPPLSVDELIAGLPDNARPKSRDEAVAIKRAKDWLTTKIAGKRFKDQHTISEVAVYGENGGTFKAYVYPQATAKVGEDSWRVKFTTQESGYGSGGLLMKGLDDVSAERLQKLQGQTAIVTGKFDSVSFAHDGGTSLVLLIVLADVGVEAAK